MLAKDMDNMKLNCPKSTEVLGSTPEVLAKSVARTRGAPSKRILPSLGLGNASTMAKDLEKLSLVSDTSPTVNPAPVLKEKNPSRVRISSLDILNLGVKRIVPKVKVTENTPKKFFKSKESGSLTSPTLKSITSVGKVSSSKTKAFKLDLKPPQ